MSNRFFYELVHSKVIYMQIRPPVACGYCIFGSERPYIDMKLWGIGLRPRREEGLMGVVVSAAAHPARRHASVEGWSRPGAAP